MIDLQNLQDMSNTAVKMRLDDEKKGSGAAQSSEPIRQQAGATVEGSAAQQGLQVGAAASGSAVHVAHDEEDKRKIAKLEEALKKLKMKTEQKEQAAREETKPAAEARAERDESAGRKPRADPPVAEVVSESLQQFFKFGMQTNEDQRVKDEAYKWASSKGDKLDVKNGADGRVAYKAYKKRLKLEISMIDPTMDETFKWLDSLKEEDIKTVKPRTPIEEMWARVLARRSRRT